MKSRLLQFISAENITQSQFADSIGVARASVSHILSGRNKPSYEFIIAMLRHYPQLNPEWLLLGIGRMYKDSGGQARQSVEIPAEDLLFPVDFESAEQPSGDEAESPEAATLSKGGDTAPMHVSLTAATQSQTIQTAQAQSQTVQTAENQSRTAQTAAQAQGAAASPRQTVGRLSKVIVFFDDGTFRELR